jgi:hypothetical protein
MSKPIPISQSFDSYVITNKNNNIQLGTSAPTNINESIIKNYLLNKVKEINNNDDSIPILGSSPILKPEGVAGKSITTLKNLLNFKL